VIFINLVDIYKKIETVMKDRIKQLLKESSEGEKESQASSSAQYQRIYSLLKDKIFNHAEIIEKLWGDKEATNRSLFGKKLNHDPNASGVKQEFNDEEIRKIAQILLDTSSEIKKNLGGKSQE